MDSNRILMFKYLSRHRVNANVSVDCLFYESAFRHYDSSEDSLFEFLFYKQSCTTLLESIPSQRTLSTQILRFPGYTVS